jgi:hypothetical protein
MNELLPVSIRDNILIRYIFELGWSTHKLLSNFVGKFDCGKEIANAKSEAHVGLEVV